MLRNTASNLLKEQLATAAQLQVKEDAALLDEVTGLVEWPVPLIGTIDAQFMDLPPEVLTTSMRAKPPMIAGSSAKARSPASGRKSSAMPAT